MAFKFRQRRLADPLAQENFEQLEALQPGRAIGAFRYYVAASYTHTNATRVAFTGKTFDREGWFDTSNAVWVPKVAGVYRITWHVAVVTSAWTTGNYLYTWLSKNNATYADGLLVPSITSSTVNLRSSGSQLVDMNGSTDFLDVRASNASFGTFSVAGDGAGTTSMIQADFVGRL